MRPPALLRPLLAALAVAALAGACGSGEAALPPVTPEASGTFLATAADRTFAQIRYGSVTFRRETPGGATVFAGTFDRPAGAATLAAIEGAEGELRAVDGGLFARFGPSAQVWGVEPGVWYELAGGSAALLPLLEVVGLTDWLQLARATTGPVTLTPDQPPGATRYAASVDPAGLAPEISPVGFALSVQPGPVPVTFDVSPNATITALSARLATPGGSPTTVTLNYERLPSPPLITIPPDARPLPTG